MKLLCAISLLCLPVLLCSGFSISSAIGTSSTPSRGPVKLTLIHRFQSYNHKPHDTGDVYDQDIQSPKSVRCAADTDRVYVNSLEGMKTVVYNADTFEKVGLIHHIFRAQDQALFDKVSPKNVFSGKPVESALTHNGKYLWVPYYRRDFDAHGVEPSAVAVINTESLKIERVFETGPISKYVFPSPDGRWLVISNWGNNTLSVIDIEDPDARDCRVVATLTVEYIPDLRFVKGDRDNDCGFCLRGLAFTKDSRFLFVARMGGGGIAVFDMHDNFKYLGSVFGMKPTPRDILLSHDGKSLYVSSNAAGVVSRLDVATLINAALNASGKHVTVPVTQEVEVGGGARTIRLSPDERFLFVALNTKSEVAVVDTQTLRVVSRIPVDAFPVGLDISPDGQRLWVTSQAKATGGDAVSVFSVEYANQLK